MITEARGGDIHGLGSFFMPINPHFFRKRRAAAYNDERLLTSNKFPSPRELAILQQSLPTNDENEIRPNEAEESKEAHR